MSSTVWNTIVGEQLSFSLFLLFCIDMVIWLAFLVISSSRFISCDAGMLAGWWWALALSLRRPGSHDEYWVFGDLVYAFTSRGGLPAYQHPVSTAISGFACRCMILKADMSIL
jgi:hypothetical protein